MINILATIILGIMCYVISEFLAFRYAEPKYMFMWGWILSIATGFFINWFAKAISKE